MSGLKIAICDDDYMSREANALMTKQILEQEGIAYECAVYESAKALLNAMQEASFHILLLDVMMTGMDGMELAIELRKQKSEVDIIFISGDRENALRGYEVSAARYLIKPVMMERLKEALLYCYERYKDSSEFVVLSSVGNCKIYLSEICYVEAYERGTIFHLKDNMINTKLKMHEVEELLPQDKFMLCHRAYIVNLSEVRAVRRYEIELKNSEIIPVSRVRYTLVCEMFAK